MVSGKHRSEVEPSTPPHSPIIHYLLPVLASDSPLGRTEGRRYPESASTSAPCTTKGGKSMIGYAQAASPLCGVLRFTWMCSQMSTAGIRRVSNVS